MITGRLLYTSVTSMWNHWCLVCFYDAGSISFYVIYLVNFLQDRDYGMYLGYSIETGVFTFLIDADIMTNYLAGGLNKKKMNSDARPPPNLASVMCFDFTSNV